MQTRTVETWNEWRKSTPTLRPDLRGANLAAANLWNARLDNTDLRGANLDMAQLNYADLRDSNLGFSRLVAANLTMVRAEGASLRGANLSHAVLNGAQLQGADLTGARVAGTSAWGVGIDDRTRQLDLVVDAWVDPLERVVVDTGAALENIIVHCDHIEAAHLLYLVSTRGKFKTIVDAMTARVVLLLGNFGSHRKKVLNAVRHKLAEFGYAPVVFDFTAPVDRDLIETIALIAGLSRFVIADLTRPKSTPLESLLIAPQLMVPFASIIYHRERPFSMFRSLQAKYDWVLPTWSYRNQAHLIQRLKTEIVDPCERMRAKLSLRREAARVSARKKRRRAVDRLEYVEARSMQRCHYVRKVHELRRHYLTPRRRTISQLTPAPKASMSPMSPSRGGAVSWSSRRTKNTVDETMLP